MSKKLSTTLLILVAFFVLGFSISANAAKPVPESEITSEPLMGNVMYCLASNVTDTEKAVVFKTFFVNTQNSVLYGPNFANATVVANGFAYLLVPNNQNARHIGRCSISWLGKPEEVKGTLCALGPAPDYLHQGCSDLN